MKVFLVYKFLRVESWPLNFENSRITFFSRTYNLFLKSFNLLLKVSIFYYKTLSFAIMIVTIGHKKKRKSGKIAHDRAAMRFLTPQPWNFCIFYKILLHCNVLLISFLTSLLQTENKNIENRNRKNFTQNQKKNKNCILINFLFYWKKEI